MPVSTVTRLVGFALCLGVVAGCTSAPPIAPSAQNEISAPRTDSGTLGDAPYRIDIPANWNGELVMLLHGYEPKGMPRWWHSTTSFQDRWG
jgi:hypothetical protein